MTLIATPPGIDNAKLSLVARSLILNADDPENTKLLKLFNIKVTGADGFPVEVPMSFEELDGLMNILDLGRLIPVKIEPVQWAVLTYGLKDLEELLRGEWRVTEYSIDLDAEKRVASFVGTVNHIHCIVGHPEYNALVARAPKVFEYELGDFDIVQQMALSRVIAAREPKFDPVAGTFDVSYVFSVSPKGVNFATKGIEE